MPSIFILFVQTLLVITILTPWDHTAQAKVRKTEYKDGKKSYLVLEDFSDNGLKVYNQIIVSKDFRQEAFDHNKDGFIDEKIISRKVGKDRITIHYKHYLWGDTFLLLTMKRRHSKGIQEARYQYDFQTKNYKLVSSEDRPFRTYNAEKGKTCSSNSKITETEASFRGIKHAALVESIKKHILDDSCKDWEEESDGKKSADIIAEQIARGMEKFDESPNCLSKNGNSYRAMQMQARFEEMLQEGNEYKVSCRKSEASRFLNASYSEEKKEICFHKKLPDNDPNFYENKFIHEALHSVGEEDESYVYYAEYCCDDNKRGYQSNGTSIEDYDVNYCEELKSYKQRREQERLSLLTAGPVSEIKNYKKREAYRQMLGKLLAKHEEQCVKGDGSLIGCDKPKDYENLIATIKGDKEFLNSISACNGIESFCTEKQKSIVEFLESCTIKIKGSEDMYVKHCQEKFFNAKTGVWPAEKNRVKVGKVEYLVVNKYGVSGAFIIPETYAKGDNNKLKGNVAKNDDPIVVSFRGGGPPTRGYAARRSRNNRGGPPIGSGSRISPIGKTSGVDYTDETRSRRNRSYNTKTQQASRGGQANQGYKAQRVELENIVDRTNPVLKEVGKFFSSAAKTVSNFIVPEARAQTLPKNSRRRGRSPAAFNPPTQISARDLTSVKGRINNRVIASRSEGKTQNPQVSPDISNRKPASQKPLDFIEDSDKLKGEIKVSSASKEGSSNDATNGADSVDGAKVEASQTSVDESTQDKESPDNNKEDQSFVISTEELEKSKEENEQDFEGRSAQGKLSASYGRGRSRDRNRNIGTGSSKIQQGIQNNTQTTIQLIENNSSEFAKNLVQQNIRVDYKDRAVGKITNYVVHYRYDQEKDQFMLVPRVK